VNDVPGVPHDRVAYAGFWRRFAAYAVDYMIIFLSSLALAIVGSLTGFLPDGAPLLSVLVFAEYFFYCALLESSSWQATLGKRALGIKVMNRRGERIGFGRAAARFAAKFLSALTLCLGYLAMLFTQRRQALHDLIAGTLVTYDAPRHKAAR
jgi:uncharacterized RDD family membrane protein YckC